MNDEDLLRAVLSVARHSFTCNGGNGLTCQCDAFGSQQRTLDALARILIERNAALAEVRRLKSITDHAAWLAEELRDFGTGDMRTHLHNLIKVLRHDPEQRARHLLELDQDRKSPPLDDV